MKGFVCLMGPTASGKSGLAVELARRLDGEVVNADSMQVFRDLPVGTAAPTADQLAAVPHHLFATLDPDQEPDSGTWARDAAAVIDDILARGRLPVVVGGTFFWFRALLDGLSDIPRATAEARAGVRDALAREGLPALYHRLRRVDPDLAARLAPGDTQRICRALEVFDSTGTPLSVFQAAPARPATRVPSLRLVLDLPRDVLYRRIDLRVDAMIAEGLVDEVRAVLDRGFSRDCRPLRSGSYRPVIDFLDGRIGPREMRDLVAQSHRNYAKRQLTWLAREPGLRIAAGDVEAALVGVRGWREAGAQGTRD